MCTDRRSHISVDTGGPVHGCGSTPACCLPGHAGEGCTVTDVSAETVLLWTHTGRLMPRRWQVALCREELLPYLLPRVMTCSPRNCVLTRAGSHQQMGKGLQPAAQQATGMGTGRATGWMLQDSDAVQ